jgi:uncharacterized membrane protein
VNRNLTAGAYKTAKHVNDEGSSHRTFPSLFVIGFSILFVGMIFLMVAMVLNGFDGSKSFGAVIFVGPFPIVIGAGPNAMLMILVAIVLAVLSIIVFLLTRRRMKSQFA